MANTFGEYLRVTTFGESHGPGVGAVIDGMPAGVPIVLEEITAALRRRRPGQALTSPRQETDEPRILSGVFEGRSLGSPLTLWIENRDARPADYEALRDTYRPGHADLATELRYGWRDHRGGGRASARETAARVAAGAIALALLRTEHPIEIVGWVERVGALMATIDPATVTAQAVDANPVRCPDPALAAAMEARIAEARAQQDSLGGWVGAVARGVPSGWGDPVFGGMKALLGAACLSLPAAVAVEIGDGLAATARTGSEHNDALEPGSDGRPCPATNRAGGVQGGITTGAPVVVRVGFKPPSSIARAQRTVDRANQPHALRIAGRHDPCVLPRAVPVVEAMLALVLADRMLAWRAAPPWSQRM